MLLLLRLSALSDHDSDTLSMNGTSQAGIFILHFSMIWVLCLQVIPPGCLLAAMCFLFLSLSAVSPLCVMSTLPPPLPPPPFLGQFCLSLCPNIVQSLCPPPTPIAFPFRAASDVAGGSAAGGIGVGFRGGDLGPARRPPLAQGQVHRR